MAGVTARYHAFFGFSGVPLISVQYAANPALAVDIGSHAFTLGKRT